LGVAGTGDETVGRAALITPLSRDTLQEQVHRQLCDLILDGRLAPGETITIQGLADAFGVSPMPVREALKRLTAANALTIVSGRSVGIPRLSRARLSDLRDVRMEIEPLAAGWGVLRATPEDIASAARHLEGVEAAAAGGDLQGYLRSNHALHFAVYRASRSEILLRIIEDLWLQISPYFHKLHASTAIANTHHREMVEALAAGDEAAVRRALRADIDSAYRSLIPQLEP
jgi:DNA-binding GntR family transcriptional regulator